MKKYSILLFLMVTIIIGVIILITSPEFFNSEPLPVPGVRGYSIKAIQEENAEMKKIQDILSKRKLQPTLASTIGQVFILPQPDMPNHFVSVKYPNKQYISYKTTHI